ncbi:MAG: DUF1844 domain-containing protein [Nitrospiria bacterium]
MKEEEFEVRDRRTSAMGEREEKAAEENPSLDAKKETTTATEGERSQERAEAYPVNFASFILSLATSVLIHLGEEANPATGEKSVQLPMARQVIDLLTLLEAKTKGNLTKDEENLITQLLFTLRMKFVEMEKKSHS